jgi:spore photoproduct lyase
LVQYPAIFLKSNLCSFAFVIVLVKETIRHMLHEKSIDHLLTIHEIYHEANVREFARGREILAKYPDARLIEVESHNKIPELFGFEGSVEDWIWNKKNVLILGS